MVPGYTGRERGIKGRPPAATTSVSLYRCSERALLDRTCALSQIARGAGGIQVGLTNRRSHLKPTSMDDGGEEQIV